MAKKEWTDEERAAFGAKMKAAKQAKQTEDEPKKTDPVDPGPPGNPEVEDLKRMVMELQAAMFKSGQGNPNQGVTMNKGVVSGTLERYSLNPKDYPDPRVRLAAENKLAQFAFDYNYELEYSCNPTRRYETVDGIWQRDPQFNLELIRIMRDEVSGEDTGGRYTICRGIFFEDPDSAIMTAQEMGLDIDTGNEKQFLDEMRYIWMRNWLLDAFFPAPAQNKKNRREMVIDGKLVDYFEVNSENSESIPFDKLKSKI